MGRLPREARPRGSVTYGCRHAPRLARPGWAVFHEGPMVTRRGIAGVTLTVKPPSTDNRLHDHRPPAAGSETPAFPQHLARFCLLMYAGRPGRKHRSQLSWGKRVIVTPAVYPRGGGDQRCNRGPPIPTGVVMLVHDLFDHTTIPMNHQH